jgi:hypothetical protein
VEYFEGEDAEMNIEPMKTISVDALKLFCSTDPERPYLHRPWSSGEYTYATNGHVLVRVPRIAEVEENKDAPNAAKILASVEAQAELVPLPPMDGLPSPVKEDCRSRDGSGIKHHDCPDCACPCWECDGLGYEVEQISAPLNGALYNLQYLLLIAKLPDVKFAAAPPSDGPARFSFGKDGKDGEGALMPLRSAHSHHVALGK